MFDIGWSEMMVIGVVALIVVGPKDLPKMFHTIGQFTGKAKGMAREFQRAMDAAARETGVNDIAKDLRKTASGQSFKEAAGFDEIEKQFKSIGRTGPDVRKPAKPGQTPAAKADTAAGPDLDDESEADEAAAAGHDADLAARNAEATAVEEERLRKQKRADATRLKAAAIRARKEAEAAQAAADAAEAEAWNPATRKPKDES